MTAAAECGILKIDIAECYLYHMYHIKFQNQPAKRFYETIKRKDALKMKYDLSPLEAEIINNYRDLTPRIQEYMCNFIISLCGAENMIKGIENKSKKPEEDEGKKRPDKTEKEKQKRE